MRSTMGVVLGAVLALGLSACGGGGDDGAKGAAPTKDYCSAARGLAGKRPGPAAIVAKVQAVGNASPGEVARAWHDISEAIQTYAEVAQRSLQNPAKPPVGLSPAETRALNARLIATAYHTNVGPLSAEVKKVRQQISSECGFKIAL